MDAVPMMLGQEFAGFAVTLSEDHRALQGLIRSLGEINLGGAAIGTGIPADPRFAEAARRHLAEITGYELRAAANLVEATTDVGVFMQLSGALKRTIGTSRISS